MASSRQLTALINLKIINLLTGVPESKILLDVSSAGLTQDNLNDLSRIISAFFNYGLLQRGLVNATAENMLALQSTLNPVYNQIMSLKCPSAWISSIGKYSPTILNYWTVGEGAKFIPVLRRLRILTISPNSLNFFYMFREILPSFLEKLELLNQFAGPKFIDYLRMIGFSSKSKYYIIALLDVISDLIKTDYASLENVKIIAQLPLHSLVKMKETLNQYLSGTFQANSIENLICGVSCLPFDSKKRTYAQIVDNEAKRELENPSHNEQVQLTKKLRLELTAIRRQIDFNTAVINRLQSSTTLAVIAAPAPMAATGSAPSAPTQSTELNHGVQAASAQPKDVHPSALAVPVSANQRLSFFNKPTEQNGVIKPLAIRPGKSNSINL